METICKLITQTCCFCYRCQRICTCGEFCYKIDKHFIQQDIQKENEQVIMEWQKITVHHNLGKNAQCEKEYFGTAQVCCTDKAIYIKTNPSPFCGLFGCFKLCGKKCYSCCCNIGIPLRIPLEDIETQQGFEKQQMDMHVHLACNARTYDKSIIQLNFYNSSTITLIMEEKFELWKEEFPKLITNKKSNPEKQDSNQIEFSKMQQPLMDEKQCFI